MDAIYGAVLLASPPWDNHLELKKKLRKPSKTIAFSHQIQATIGQGIK